MGFVNGIGVAYFKVPSIIMTLGMLGIIRGIMLLYTEGMWIEDIPNFYKKLSGLKMLGISITSLGNYCSSINCTFLPNENKVWPIFLRRWGQ